MNPMFVFLVILCAIALWFLLAFSYKPIGKLFHKIWKDSVDAIKDKKEKESEEK